MTQKSLEEQISAFIDDELDPRELPLFTAQVSRNPDLRRKLLRYRLAGDCLRGEHQRAGSVMDLAERVQAALIADAPAASMAPPRRQAPAWRWTALGAAAAVVLAVAVVMQAPVQQPTGSETMLAASDSRLSPITVAVQPLPAPVRAEAQAAAARQMRMTSYLVYHGEFAGTLSSRTVASRIVDQDSGARWMPARHAVHTHD
ncbi:MAG: hypothetical protein JJT85_12540 [Chromatiales bacterium]|nr:hypothetical protein [Chromatiales bacterium]